MAAKLASRLAGFFVLAVVVGLGYTIIHVLPPNGQVHKSQRVKLVVEFEPRVREKVVKISHGLNETGSPVITTKASPWSLAVITKSGDEVSVGAYQTERGLLTCHILLEKVSLHSQAHDGPGGVNCHAVVP